MLSGGLAKPFLESIWKAMTSNLPCSAGGRRKADSRCGWCLEALEDKALLKEETLKA